MADEKQTEPHSGGEHPDADPTESRPGIPNSGNPHPDATHPGKPHEGEEHPGEGLCFAAGSMIETPDGEVAVETLQIGDLVITVSGQQVPVKWVGRQTFRPAASNDEKLQPVRISEGALEAGKPNRDLVLTASHGVIIDGLVINAGALVNHSSISFVPLHELPETVTYYHIETEAHEVILANGTEAETYVDYIERQAFDNYDEYVELYGSETRIIEMPRHRISSRRLLPLALRQKLGIGMARDPLMARSA
ncbi:hypothetical protein HCU01_01430 [Halomonas cupida]|uniref:Hint domain-containing protein n=1 Tax=Halomonas cupida TaxID=44933 RepID=A0A1M7B091_9GAMM|nr:Hint domain-containing protein [Halomonas cupida]GEN22194.1 hypothetical protein HCU01_01430 [Halomonas cupida]SHL48306.1 Hint domain-containing protein [Halomonas cupida]